ncbi:MAG: hypothetical protein ABJB78_00165, partial [Betaproteobacteria bacterium]
AEGVARLRAALDLGVGLDGFVPDAEARETLAQAAMKSGQVRMNPRLATIEDMRSIIEAMRAPTAGQAPVVAL